mgnify:CR=1 FL=1
MKIIKTKIPDILIVKTQIHKDKRGFLKETFQKKILGKIDFPFDIMSYSKKNVLRGLHLQLKRPQAKLITVTHGEILDVAVDLRKKSKFFGKHVALKISDKSDFSLFIPKGFAHGFVCLSSFCTVNYKCSEYRHAEYESTLLWNDKNLNINWQIKKPIISDKDKNGKNLNFFKNLK